MAVVSGFKIRVLVGVHLNEGVSLLDRFVVVGGVVLFCLEMKERKWECVCEREEICGNKRGDERGGVGVNARPPFRLFYMVYENGPVRFTKLHSLYQLL